MQRKYSIYAISLSLLLTACGSTKTSGSVGPWVGQTELKGLIATTDSNGNKAIVSSAQSDRLDTIIINGVSINVVPLAEKDFTVISNDEQKKVISGSEYTDSRFGYASVTQSNQKTAGFFSHGQVTPSNNMPVNGIARYRGQAVAFRSENSNSQKGIFAKGNAELIATFGTAQKVTGVLSNWKKVDSLSTSNSLNQSDIPVININSNINGNTFSQSGQTKVNGQFYGLKFNEIGGVGNINDQNIEFSFGGKKR